MKIVFHVFNFLSSDLEQSTPLSSPQNELPPHPRSNSSSLRSISPAARPPPPKRRKQQVGDNLDTLIMTKIEKLSAEQDEASSFGEHVASRLRVFTLRQRARACLETDRVLFDIEFPNEPVFCPPTTCMSYSSSFTSPNSHYPQ